jgi:mono/diheme cytochrome c family protein
MTMFSVGVLAMLSGCRPDLDVDTSNPEKTPSEDYQSAVLEEGRAAYTTYCAGCHGEQGDGNGPAAGFLSPRPRNFITAQFKFSSTRSGRLPTDEDLKRTIREGLRGSAMPPWPFLTEGTIDSLVSYIKTFSSEWDKPAAPRIPLVNDPYRADEEQSEAIARGEAVYHGFAACWSCHPAYVSEEKINDYLVQFGGSAREEFPESLYKVDMKINEAGEATYPPDFHREYVRSGANVDDLYRSIAAGVTGTAMPTWIDSIALTHSDGTVITEPDDLWALAYYVQDLIRHRPAKLEPGRFVVRDRTQTLFLHGEIPPPLEQATTPGAGDAFEEEFEEFEED